MLMKRGKNYSIYTITQLTYTRLRYTAAGSTIGALYRGRI